MGCAPGAPDEWADEIATIGPAEMGSKDAMFRWLLTIFIALAVFAAALPWLEKLGVGRLPGDVRLRLFGKIYLLPFASTILLSLVIFLALRLFR